MFNPQVTNQDISGILKQAVTHLALLLIIVSVCQHSEDPSWSANPSKAITFAASLEILLHRWFQTSVGCSRRGECPGLSLDLIAARETQRLRFCLFSFSCICFCCSCRVCKAGIKARCIWFCSFSTKNRS